jgi:type IV pilus assembly protein PilO
MALIPARDRDKYMLLVVIAAIGLASAYYMYLWSPRKDELDATQAHVDSLVVMNQRAKSELAQGKTQELKAEAERFASDLEVMRRLVPTGNEVPALLEQVSTAARRVGLDIADVQPLPLLQGDQYDAYKYRLSVRGDYHEIAVLLANIGSLQRIVEPINLTLAPANQPAGSPASSRKQLVEARFEIQTYVARTSSTPVAKGGDTPPAGE